MNYESNITKFIKDYLKNNPDAKSNQSKARKIWWDKKQEQTKNDQLSKWEVKKKAYEYY